MIFREVMQIKKIRSLQGVIPDGQNQEEGIQHSRELKKGFVHCSTGAKKQNGYKVTELHIH